MPQSLLAFLAMMIATMAAFNQMSAKLGSYNEMIYSEFELMANAVAIDQMERIDLLTDYEDLETWDSALVERSFESGSRTVTFDLAITVRWVDDEGNPSAIETDQKEVEIQAMEDHFSRVMVTHSRIFSD
ncbi:MAG: hypothetical protein RIE53_12545 [Rhodothermales bacterium]